MNGAAHGRSRRRIGHWRLASRRRYWSSRRFSRSGILPRVRRSSLSSPRPTTANGKPNPGARRRLVTARRPAARTKERSSHAHLRQRAQLILDGPAIVELAQIGGRSVCRPRGALVPTQAIGFTVATPIAQFVDLGTEFTLALEPNNSCELQVFDGLVEMQLAATCATRRPKQLRISEGSAVRFDADTFDVRSIPYDEEQRITQIDPYRRMMKIAFPLARRSCCRLLAVRIAQRSPNRPPTNSCSPAATRCMSASTTILSTGRRSAGRPTSRMMKEAGFNIVRVAEFSWVLFEPSEGEFDFSWLDRWLELAEKHDMKVIIGTPTAIMPAWLAKKYPDALSQKADGTRTVWGGRRHNCFSDADYRRLV